MKTAARHLQSIVYSGIALSLAISLMGCNQEEAFDCFKSTGPTREIEVSTEYFKSIDLHDNMGLVLRNAPSPEVTIRGGKNLITKIGTDVRDSILILENRNFCNWVRDYDAITVEIGHPSLEILRLFGYGPVSTKDTLNIENVFWISATESTSRIDLKLTGQHLVITSNNTNNITLSGSLVVGNFGFFFNDALLDARDLQLEQLDILHQGYYDMLVNVSEEVTGTLASSGNLVLYQEPAFLNVEELGDGKVIMIED